MILSRSAVVEERDEELVERDGCSGAGDKSRGSEGAEWREACAAKVGERGRDCVPGEQQFAGNRDAASEPGRKREYPECAGGERFAPVDERSADGGARMVVHGGHVEWEWRGVKHSSDGGVQPVQPGRSGFAKPGIGAGGRCWERAVYSGAGSVGDVCDVSTEYHGVRDGGIGREGWEWRRRQESERGAWGCGVDGVGDNSGEDVGV